MRNLSKLRPSPALVVAMAALVMAMSGAAIALPGKNTVSKNDIKNGAVTKKKIAKGAVGSQQIKGKSIKGNRLKDGAIKAKQLAEGAVTGAKIADGAVSGDKVLDDSLSDAKITDYEVISSDAGNFVKLTATDGATEAAARTAAPATTLFAKGDLTFSAKCFRDTTADIVYAEIYARTAANGAILDGEDTLEGGNAASDFLNTNTAEEDAEIDSTDAGTTSASLEEGEFTVVGPDGTHLIGQVTTAAKNGSLAGGNGVYGDGNVCLFGGEIAG